MARSYNFAVLRLAPENARNEVINIGVIIFAEDRLIARFSKGLEKARVISAALEPAMIEDLVQSLETIDEETRNLGILDPKSRLQALTNIRPLQLNYAGNFVAESAGIFENRISSILKALVDPEPAPRRPKVKRSKLLTQVKQTFKRERILARKNEGLSSHRILAGYELDEGIIADLVLKNGALHVIETVDASSDLETAKKAIAEIAVSALILERARMKFEGQELHGRLVYEANASLERIARPALDAVAHQGAALVNWSSFSDQKRFIEEISSLAIPLETEHKGSQSRTALVMGKLKFH